MFAIWFDGTWCEIDDLILHCERSNDYVIAHSVQAAIDFLNVLLGIAPLAPTLVC